MADILQILRKTLLNESIFAILKPLGSIDRRFHEHGKSYGFVLYEYIIEQSSSFCKYTNISFIFFVKRNKENN